MDVRIKETDKIIDLPVDRVVTVQNDYFSIADTQHNINNFEIEEVLNDSN